jgi:hypothetical protein
VCPVVLVLFNPFVIYLRLRANVAKFCPHDDGSIAAWPFDYSPSMWWPTFVPSIWCCHSASTILIYSRSTIFGSGLCNGCWQGPFTYPIAPHCSSTLAGALGTAGERGTDSSWFTFHHCPRQTQLLFHNIKSQASQCLLDSKVDEGHGLDKRYHWFNQIFTELQLWKAPWYISLRWHVAPALWRILFQEKRILAKFHCVCFPSCFSSDSNHGKSIW